jgi:hypothetical protein
VAGLLDRIAGRTERHDRVDQGVPELLRDLAGGVACDRVVFDEGHVRPVLLDAAGVDDRGGLARGHCLANFQPREIFGVDRPCLSGSR